MQAMLKSHLQGLFSKIVKGRQSQFEGMTCEMRDAKISSDFHRTSRI